MLDILIGNNILVWREKKGWKGPYPLLLTDGKNYIVILPSRPTNFRIISVKKYYSFDSQAEETPQIIDKAINKPETDQIYQRPTCNRNLLKRFQETDISYKSYIVSKESDNFKLVLKLREDGIIRSAAPPFVDSRKKEIEGLLDQRVFKIIKITEMPLNNRLFGSRFVDKVKCKEGVLYKKSRLVI